MRRVQVKLLSSCILGNVGSSIFGALHKLQTKSKDISVSAAPILIILISVCLLCVPIYMEVQ